MIDLTRALYLGLAHPSDALAPWPALTTGRPAALDRDPLARSLAAGLAARLGVERATLAPSTLHLVTDLYAVLPARVRRVHVDACAYAVTRWGLERARLRGVDVRRFRSARELTAQLDRGVPSAIVADALCVRCGRISPLAGLAALARRSRGWLVVDDSQGIGLLGTGPSPVMPYGHGGTGTLQWAGAETGGVIVIGSLAKAFGAPLAFLAGSHAIVDWFERTSGTRVHTSPCSAAALAALDRALHIDAGFGQAIRGCLLDRVRAFRAATAAAGGELRPGVFPVQSTRPLVPARAIELERRLLERGVRALRLDAGGGRNHVAFVVTAAHDPEALTRAGTIVGASLRRSDALAA